MGPSQAVRSVLGNYVNFTDRASRSEYWWFAGAVWLAYVISFALLAISVELGFIVYFVILFGTLVPGLAVAVRRLHDTGRSGWWLLLGLVPLLGIVLIVFMLLDSESGQNRYGAPPAGSRYYAGI